MLSVARLLTRGTCVSHSTKLKSSVPNGVKYGIIQFTSPLGRTMSQDLRGGYASRLTRKRPPTLKERAMGPASGSGYY